MPKVIKKEVAAKVTKPVAKEQISKPAEKLGKFSAPMFSLEGKSLGVINLPKEVFGNPVNSGLLAQALRVYSNNLKVHAGNTKTRGEVHGTTAKIYKQKGTGRARHGAKTAPIFRGGGVAFGPKFRKTKLELPKKMKKIALLSAFAQKMQDQQILAISDLTKATGKTKQLSNFLKITGKKNSLIITEENNNLAYRASRNIPSMKLLPFNQINVYEVIKYQTIIFTKQAIENLQKNLNEEVVKEGVK